MQITYGIYTLTVNEDGRITGAPLAVANLIGTKAPEIPAEWEYYEGKFCHVLDASRLGWWRFHAHYDRNGYCDNPARGY